MSIITHKKGWRASVNISYVIFSRVIAENNIEKIRVVVGRGLAKYFFSYLDGKLNNFLNLIIRQL